MKVLLVEDEVKLGQALKKGLEQDGYAVDLLHTYDDGLAYATTEEYNFIILDRMLPDKKDGLELCNYLRENNNQTPIIMLTALGSTDDIVTGLDNGADDYILKPFKYDELLARLRAIKRRPKQVVSPELKLNDLSVNLDRKEVKRGNKAISLSKKEFAVFEYLLMNSNTISSKELILQNVWNFDSDVLPNTVEVFIKSIRKKIDKPGADSYIETLRGFGYRIRNTQGV